MLQNLPKQILGKGFSEKKIINRLLLRLGFLKVRSDVKIHSATYFSIIFTAGSLKFKVSRYGDFTCDLTPGRDDWHMLLWKRLSQVLEHFKWQITHVVDPDSGKVVRYAEYFSGGSAGGEDEASEGQT